MFDKSCFNWCGDYEWFFPRTGKEVSRDAVDD